MARLTMHGSQIERVDLWPEAADIGRPVILSGGKVGILLDWRNVPEVSEWRWRAELYNHR